MKRNKSLIGRRSLKVTASLGLAVALTGAAWGFQQAVPGITFLQTVTGPLVLPAPPVPTVMQFQKIILKQGASTGWHHHDGPAWVILENGSIVVETHLRRRFRTPPAGNSFYRTGRADPHGAKFRTG